MIYIRVQESHALFAKKKLFPFVFQFQCRTCQTFFNLVRAIKICVYTREYTHTSDTNAFVVTVAIFIYFSRNRECTIS